MFYAVIVCGAMLVLSSLRAYTVGIDLEHHYASNFLAYTQMSWSSITDFGIEIGIFTISKIIGIFTNNIQAFILVTSVLSYVLTFRFFYRYSDDFRMSVFLFVVYCVFYQYMNQIAQAIAVGFVLLGYDFIKKKKPFGYVLCVLAGTTFHSSALFCLLFLLFGKIKVSKYTIIWFSIGAAAFSYLYNYLFEIAVRILPQYAWYSTNLRHGISDTGLGVWVKIALTAAVVLFAFYTRKRVETDTGNYNFMLYCSYFAFIFTLITLQMIVMNRMAYYVLPFVFLIVPKCVSLLKRNRFIVKIGIYVIMSVYFVYITVKWAEYSYGVVPYELFNAI